MNQKIRVLTPDKFVVSEWPGGKTTQIAISPPESLYQNRDFMWRLSSATIETDRSEFTALPDYSRLISVIKGEMLLTHDSGQTIRLLPDMVHSFDGGEPTRSEGRCIDYNLMLRKGCCEGSLQTVRLISGASISLSCAQPSPRQLTNSTAVLFCTHGGVEVRIGDAMVVLCEQTAAVIDKVALEVIALRGLPYAALLLAVISSEE